MNDKKFLCYFFLHLNKVMWTKPDAWPIQRIMSINVYRLKPFSLGVRTGIYRMSAYYVILFNNKKGFLIGTPVYRRSSRISCMVVQEILPLHRRMTIQRTPLHTGTAYVHPLNHMGKPTWLDG